MSHEDWATDVQQEVWEHWQQKHDDWPYGVKVFYSPIHSETDVLILGYQPGGNKTEFEANRDFSPPKNHQYIDRNWDLSNEMQEIFAGNKDVLKNSVASNIVFFRSPDVGRWKELEKSRRSNMEGYCWSYVEELIERVDPKVILSFGIGTYDEIASRLNVETEVHEKRGEDRLVVSSTESTPRIIGAMHVSGARISTDDRDRMYTGVRELLEQNTAKFTVES